jgi:hypothetical protein
MLTANYMDGSTQVVNPHPAFFVNDKEFSRKPMSIKDKVIALARSLHFSPLRKVTLYRGTELVVDVVLIKTEDEPADVKVNEKKAKKQLKREFKLSQRNK